jgi:hypothetical protein
MIWIYETIHAIKRHFSFLALVIKIEYRKFFQGSKGTDGEIATFLTFLDRWADDIWKPGKIMIEFTT